MKKVQLLFVVLAILVAGAGVFANARSVFTVTYWRAADSKFGQLGHNCDVSVSLPCMEAIGTQCSNGYATVVNGVLATRTYFISKIDTSVPNQGCIEVTRQ